MTKYVYISMPCYYEKAIIHQVKCKMQKTKIHLYRQKLKDKKLKKLKERKQKMKRQQYCCSRAQDQSGHLRILFWPTQTGQSRVVGVIEATPSPTRMVRPPPSVFFFFQIWPLRVAGPPPVAEATPSHHLISWIGISFVALGFLITNHYHELDILQFILNQR